MASTSRRVYSYVVAIPEHLTFLGHATVLLEVGGARIITDPVLRPGATFLRRVPHVADLPGHTDADIVLISHLHHDHLDLRSLRMLPGDAVVVVPCGARSWLVRKGFTNVVELRPEERVTIDGVEVRATFANHSGKREPFGPTAIAVGYVVTAGPTVVYFAGDTDIFPAMASLVPQGELDIALIPVWGWGPKLGPGHLDPRRAAKATALLKPRYVVPIHWGTLSPAGMHKLQMSRLHDPPHEFEAAVRELGIDVQVLVTKPGQRVEFAP